MTKLEQLRATVAQMFENATEKKQLEDLAKINNDIDEVEQENKELVDKHAELLSAYKEAVKHTSFKEKPREVETQPTKEAPSLEAMLNEFMAQRKNS